MSDPQDRPVALETQALSLTYYTQTETCTALKGIDLSVPKGCLQMIVGPSGAGKTTLLLLLAGLLTPTAGSIRILGQDITVLSHAALSSLRLKYLGLLFQEANLLGALIAVENVEVMLHLMRPD